MEHGGNFQAVRPPEPWIKVSFWIERVVVGATVLERELASHHGHVSWEGMRREDRSYLLNVSSLGSHSPQVWQFFLGEAVSARIEKNIGAKAVYGDENNPEIGRISFRQTAGKEEDRE